MEKNDINKLSNSNAYKEIEDKINTYEHMELPDKFDRSLFDDPKARKRHLDKEFEYGKKKIIQDELTGNKLHRNHKAAKNLHKSQASAHQAEADHIDPDKKIYERALKYKMVGIEKTNEIANRPNNFETISKRSNTSKQDRTNVEMIVKHGDLKYSKEATTQGKARQVVKGIYSGAESEILLFKENTKNTIDYTISKTEVKVMDVHDNVVEKVNLKLPEKIQTVSEAALIAATVSGINNIVLVASGKKDIKQAVIDTAKDSGGSAVSATGYVVIESTITNVVKKYGAQIARESVGKVLGGITTTVMVGNSIVRYVNDDITFVDCAMEIIMNGAGMIAFSLGVALSGGLIVGGIVASAVTSAICQAVAEYRSISKLSEQQLKRLNAIKAEALATMGVLRNDLKLMITEEYGNWDKQFDNGFDSIISSALSNDVNGIAMGIDNLLNVFGQNVRFKDDQEFDDFFMNENSVFTF